MGLLVLGLAIFLGVHCTRIVAPHWRRATITRIGDGPWKLIYSAVSILGFLLIIWGYGEARAAPVVLWSPPVWTQHLAVTLNVIAFILLAVYALPTGRLKARLGHPMVLGVKVWAIAHLLANGTLADVVLFGSFLFWAVVDFAASRRRDRAQGVVRVAGPVRNDLFAVAAGLVAAVLMVTFLHEWLIGVHPLA
jgi:uncharacterized membrane protein